MNQHTQIIHELTPIVKRKDIVMRKLKKNVSASDFNDLDISLANLQNLLWVYIELNDEFRKVIPSGEDYNGKYYQGRLDMADSQLNAIMCKLDQARKELDDAMMEPGLQGHHNEATQA